jgi:soluble lytic murein transglycosylase-like protein
MDQVTLLMFGALVFGSCVSLPVVAAQPAAVSAAAPDLWTPFIAEAATRFGIPEAWIRTVMAAESGGRTTLNGRPVTSRSGAIGLMQVMPDTYEEMRHAYSLGPDPHDPRDNILAGAAYLRAMFERFGWPGFLAAYNAGPERYADHLRTGLPLPAETQSYLASLDLSLPMMVASPRSQSAANPKSIASELAEPAYGRSLFFVRNGVPQTRSEPFGNHNTDRRPNLIFVPLPHEHR